MHFQRHSHSLSRFPLCFVFGIDFLAAAFADVDVIVTHITEIKYGKHTFDKTHIDQPLKSCFNWGCGYSSISRDLSK